MASRKPHTQTVSLTVPVTVLGIDAHFEPVTQAGFEYRQAHVYPYLQQKGFTLQLFQGPMARRMYAAPAARQKGVVYITGLGHGLYDRFTGNYNEPIFTVGDYSQDETQDKIVHLLSCETARDLGPDLVAHGCKAFFGYDENFTFLMDEADTFFACDAEIDRAFADGLSAAAVYTRVLDLFNKNIAKLRDQGSDYKAATLEFDRDHLRSPTSGAPWGDMKAALL